MHNRPCSPPRWRAARWSSPGAAAGSRAIGPRGDRRGDRRLATTGGGRRLIESGAPRAVVRAARGCRRARRALPTTGRRPPARPAAAMRAAPPPRLDRYPYFRLERYVRETVASSAAQTHPAIEIVIVNDGSLRSEDGVVFDLARELRRARGHAGERGLGAARNMGISQSRGRYVLPLDADDADRPRVRRALRLTLERDPQIAYVTSWVQYIDPTVARHRTTTAATCRSATGPTDRAQQCRRHLYRGDPPRPLRGRIRVQHRPDELRGLAPVPAAAPGRPPRRRDPRAHDQLPRAGAVDDPTVGAPRLARLYEELRAHQRELEISWTA